MANRTIIGFLLFVIVISVAVNYIYFPTKDVTYNTFLVDLASSNITSTRVHGDRLTLSYWTNDDPDTTRIVTSPVEITEVMSQLLSAAVPIDTDPVNKPLGMGSMLLLSLVPVLLLIAAMVYINYRHTDAADKKQINILNPESNTVRLKDVISNPGEHDEAKDIVDFIKHRSDYNNAKAKIPRGVLLSGEPGCGKTYVAKAIAGEAGVPFFYTSGSEFDEKYVGVGASRVRALFEEARKHTPCVIFIDEIDAMARSRTDGLNSAGSGQTLMQLLVEMDGLIDNTDIIVLAATNRVDVLDAALLRPGRFDRIITVGLPDVSAREKILAINIEKINCAPDINLSALAKATAGFSGAELVNVINEATLMIAKNKRVTVTMSDLEIAKDKVIMGAECPRVMKESEIKLTAFHEAGHAIVGMLVPGHDPVYKVSVMPRGKALGVTVFLPEADRVSLSKEQLTSKITTLLAGRAAEEIIYGERNVTTGASSDLERATKLARDMVTKWGFSTKLGLSYLGNDIHSDSVKLTIDGEVESILRGCYDDAKGILHNNLGKLRKMAESLIEHETIGQDVIASIMGDVQQ